MRRAVLAVPESCRQTQCPTLWSDYVEPAIAREADPLAIAVMALSRAYRVHLVALVPNEVRLTRCNEESGREVGDVFSGVVREYTEAHGWYLDCMAVALEMARRGEQGYERKAKDCIREYAKKLAGFSGDEADAEYIANALQRDLAFIRTVAHRGSIRRDKAERLASEAEAFVQAGVTGLLIGAASRRLADKSLVVVRWLDRALVAVIEDGAGRRLFFTADADPMTFFTALSDAWPGVFRVGCSCEHAELARVVRQCRDPMVWRVAAYYALRHYPSLAEEVPKAVRSEEDALWVVTAAHSAEVGYASAVDWVGGAPLCVSLLTCPVRGIEEFIEIRK